MAEIRNNLSKNLISLRKQKNITQLELANLLNYSDKSISKWECGDTLPDIEVIHKIATFYGVTVDELISSKPAAMMPQKKRNDPIEQNNKIIITLLAASIVWFAATIIQVQVKIVEGTSLWMTYVWAVPISFVVLITFNAVWGRRKFSVWLVSALIWTLLAALYLEFLSYNVWVIFFIGIPTQIAAILWNQLSKNKYKKKQLLNKHKV